MTSHTTEEGVDLCGSLFPPSSLKLATFVGPIIQSNPEKQKPASMLKLERSPSHSWWWDSHNSPKHSRWLQSNLQDLDDKVKEMLRLVEEDADSFAQRAEMYYQKRPELVNLVEEFYRAYRSLAERYDHLTGEIRQNIPRALQVQYGLSCDSPRSASGNGGGRHHYSPLRRSNQVFENLLKKACQIDDQTKEGNQTGDTIGQHCCDDVCVDSHPNSSDEGGLSSSSSSDSEVDNLTPLNRLRREIDELKEMNKVLAESQGKALHLNTTLQSRVRDIEERYRAKEEEANGMRSKLLELNGELERLSAVARQQHDVEFHVNEAHVENVAEEIKGEMEFSTFDKGTCDSQKRHTLDMCEGEVCSFDVASAHEQRVALLDSLHDEVGLLREENRKQELTIHERGEEKREAIRQLSFSVEMLKSENQRLEVVIGQLRKRLQVSNAAATGCGASHSPFAAWMQLFSVGFKARQPFVAVAL